MQNDFLEPALIALANLQIILEEKGGPVSDGQLFEAIINIQENILQKFGLPINQDNEKLLLFDSIPTDAEVIRRIKQLHKAATKYLLSNAKSELKILRDAQQTKQDPFLVLPELKLPTHIYTVFVYEEILLKNKDSVENILQELKTSNQFEILNALGKVYNGGKDQYPAKIDFLNSVGLKYFQEFLTY